MEKDILDVKVTIDISKPATKAGFGFPLIMEGKATSAIAYTECSSLNEIVRVVGGITNEDDEQTVATKTAEAVATNIYKAANLLFSQNTPPSTVAICATTDTSLGVIPNILYHDWRQLIEVGINNTGENTRKEISNYIEENTDKMFYTSVESVSNLEGENEISGNDRTVILVHKDDNENIVFPEAALVGATASKQAGSITYKNQQLKGLTPKVLSETELKAIHKANAIAFVQKCGRGVTSEGKTTSGEYIDIIDSKDYIIQNIEYDTQMLLIENDKIPYDNTGITILENACVNVLKSAANNGMIATTDNGDYDYSVEYKQRSETSPDDRKVRKYVEGSFSFSLLGAIHEVEIRGTLVI